MSRMHRVVWSECRKAFIVAGEDAKAKGKPSSATRKAVASAVVMALTAMASVLAMAAPFPPPSGQTWSVTNANIVNPALATITGANAGIYLRSNSVNCGIALQPILVNHWS